MSNDAEVLGMNNYMGPDRTIDLYITEPPSVYKPLVAVKCDDFKSTPVQTYNLESDDEIDVQEEGVVGETMGQNGEIDGDIDDDHNVDGETQTI